MLCFIGHTRACGIKRAGAVGGRAVVFGLCGFGFLSFLTCNAFSLAYNAFLFLSAETFFEGVAWSSDGQKGKFFPFETLFLLCI